MKKILLVLLLLHFSSTAFADAINKSGFVDKKIKINRNLQVSDPSNKIIIPISNLVVIQQTQNHDP